MASHRINVGLAILTPCEFIYDPMTDERIPYRYLNKLPQEELRFEDRPTHASVAQAVNVMVDEFEAAHPESGYYVTLYKRHSAEPASTSTVKNIERNHGAKFKKDFGNDDLC